MFPVLNYFMGFSNKQVYVHMSPAEISEIYYHVNMLKMRMLASLLVWLFSLCLPSWTCIKLIFPFVCTLVKSFTLLLGGHPSQLEARLL